MPFNLYHTPFVMYMRHQLELCLFPHLSIVRLFSNLPSKICWHEIYLLQDADMVCSRAKTHFKPNEDLDTSTAVSGSANLEAYKDGYMPLHPNQQKAMYFAVRSRLSTEIVSFISQFFSIVTLTPDQCHNCPVHLIFFYEFLWWTLVLLHVVFDPPKLPVPCDSMLTLWLCLLWLPLSMFLPCRDLVHIFYLRRNTFTWEFVFTLPNLLAFKCSFNEIQFVISF